VKPARVLHVITRFNLGGAQETTLLGAALVDQARFPSEILTGTQIGLEGDLFGEAKERGVHLHFEPSLVREVNPVKDALALSRLVSFYRRYRPDIVHTHASKAGILGRAAARIAGVPIVLHTAHGWGFRPSQSFVVRSLYETLERWCAAASDRIAVVSKPTFDAAVERGIGPPEKFVVIRDAIELDRYQADPVLREAKRRELGFGPEHFVFGFVSRLSPPKDAESVVRAFARIAARHPNARLVVVGDGELRVGTERAIAELGIVDRVHMAGLRKDVPAFLSAFDAFVLVTAWEGLPRVLPQALAAGLPIITTAVDGTPEAVREGESGFLIPVGDFETLVDRMDRLAADPARAKRMGEAGKPLVEEFSARTMAHQLEDLYAELLSRGARPGARAE